MNTIIAILLAIIVVILYRINENIVRLNNNFVKVATAAQAKDTLWTSHSQRQN